jgi:hypothetical protein
MKLTNKTIWSDRLLRGMVSWCCREMRLPVREISRAHFGNRSGSVWSGYACFSTRSIRVMIGPDRLFPVEPYHYPGCTSDAYLTPRVEDRLEALIAITAHELAHIRRYVELCHLRGSVSASKLRLGSERPTQQAMRDLLARFKADRERLVAEWSALPLLKAAVIQPPRLKVRLRLRHRERL